MKQIYLQQGDVILYKENKIPAKAKKVELTTNSFVVEKGEGVHTHTLKNKEGLLQEQVQIFETKDNLYFNVGATELLLVHEEHGTSMIEPNVIISKKKEREFDYETMEARNVLD